MTFQPDLLAGRRVFVTGASSGLGRTAAVACATHGAELILSGRDADRLEETRAALPGSGHRCAVAEFTDADAAADLVKRVAGEAGPLDGIFHAAGVSQARAVRLVKQQHIDDVFRTAVDGSFGILRAAGSKGIMRDGGSVVLMSSISSQRGYDGMSVYSAAKAAVDAMVRSAALEFAGRAIRVNSIVAGAVYTEMYAREVERMGPDWIAGIGAKHPLGFGQPDDIAATVLFLLSNAARWITGTAMVVDGGYTAR